MGQLNCLMSLRKHALKTLQRTLPSNGNIFPAAKVWPPCFPLHGLITSNTITAKTGKLPVFILHHKISETRILLKKKQRENFKDYWLVSIRLRLLYETFFVSRHACNLSLMETSLMKPFCHLRASSHSHTKGDVVDSGRNLNLKRRLENERRSTLK